MGTEATRLNSVIQGYRENYSEFMALIYRKGVFCHALRWMIRQIIYLFEKAQSPAIPR